MNNNISKIEELENILATNNLEFIVNPTTGGKVLVKTDAGEVSKEDIEKISLLFLERAKAEKALEFNQTEQFNLSKLSETETGKARMEELLSEEKELIEKANEAVKRFEDFVNTLPPIVIIPKNSMKVDVRSYSNELAKEVFQFMNVNNLDVVSDIKVKIVELTAEQVRQKEEFSKFSKEMEERVSKAMEEMDKRLEEKAKADAEDKKDEGKDEEKVDTEK